MILCFFNSQLPYCLVVCISISVSQQSTGTCCSVHPSLSCFRWSHICLKLLQSLETISSYTSPVAYLPAVALGGGRGGGALVNGCGDLVDRRGAPLLRAHGAPMVVLVMGHDGHRLPPQTSLSTMPCRCWASLIGSQAHCWLFIWRSRLGSHTIAHNTTIILLQSLCL